MVNGSCCTVDYKSECSYRSSTWCCMSCWPLKFRGPPPKRCTRGTRKSLSPLTRVPNRTASSTMSGFCTKIVKWKKCYTIKIYTIPKNVIKTVLNNLFKNINIDNKIIWHCISWNIFCITLICKNHNFLASLQGWTKGICLLLFYINWIKLRIIQLLECYYTCLQSGLALNNTYAL